MAVPNTTAKVKVFFGGPRLTGPTDRLTPGARADRISQSLHFFCL